jgi:hypothetical protein
MHYKNRGGHGGEHVSGKWKGGHSQRLDVENMTINRIRWGKRDRVIRGEMGDKKDTAKSKENDINRGRKEGENSGRDHMKGDNSKGEGTRRGGRRST